MSSFKFRGRPLLAAALSVALLTQVAPALADGRRGEVFDHRYNHDHYYPQRGLAFGALPREAVTIRYGGVGYYYHGGAWYRPYGPRFVVVAPPFGAVVPFLPGFYTTVWFGGIPYYYANDAYYLWRPEVGGYVVTRPPNDGPPGTEAPAAPAASTEPFIYPKNGQSEQQQATDRYECHRWAATQASFDPTQPSNTASGEQTRSARDAYTRAFTACLDGRGYSVK